MIDNMVKREQYKESPHLIKLRSFCFIEKKLILLTNPEVQNQSQHEQKRLYQILNVGSNIKLLMKSQKYWNLKLKKTNRQRIFILIEWRTVKHIPQLIYYGEFGQRIYNKLRADEI